MADALFTFRRLEALVNAATLAVARAAHLHELPGATERYLALSGSERLTRLWPLIAPHTMNDLFRAAALLRYAEEAVTLPGDLIECGVAGGGFSLLLGSLARELGLSKTVWMCDSVAGPKGAQYAVQVSQILNLELDLVGGEGVVELGLVDALHIALPLHMPSGHASGLLQLW
jgi:hypothetical protein